MKYVTKEMKTIVEDRVILPSDIYNLGEPKAREIIAEFCEQKNLRIISFRPAQHGELYIGTFSPEFRGYDMLFEGPSNQARFIVEKVHLFPEGWWE